MPLAPVTSPIGFWAPHIKALHFGCCHVSFWEPEVTTFEQEGGVQRYQPINFGRKQHLYTAYGCKA